MRLILCIHVNDINLHINCVLFQDKNAGCYGILTFPLTYSEKREIAIYCLVNSNISTKFYSNISGVVLSQACQFCPND